MQRPIVNDELSNERCTTCKGRKSDAMWIHTYNVASYQHIASSVVLVYCILKLKYITNSEPIIYQYTMKQSKTTLRAFL